MYVEPLALFIIGEVVVVFIIISVILFRRSRLLRVLLAILTEKRLSRLHLETEEHKELLALRKDYGKLQTELLQMRREGGKTYAEQVQNRLEDLGNAPPEEEAPAEDDVTEADPNDPEGTHRTRAIRRAFYEFEAARAAPLENDIIEAEDTLLEQLKIQLGRDPDEEESELAQSQHAELLTRIRQLETVEAEYKALQKSSSEQAEQLEEQTRQIEELKRIDDTSRLDPGNRPNASGGLQDEIYRLKCERFDMAESINNLKLRLQKLVDDGDANALIDAQREQIEAQERYIDDADENIRLLEEEVAALKDATGSSAPPGQGPVNTEQIDRLAGYADEQKASMADIRDNLKALRASEKAEEKERLLAEQEAQLSRMERSVQEAETCITIMEGELNEANERIKTLEAEVESADKNDHHRKQADELEHILQQFVTDSEDMIACISGLEKHNKALRQLLLDKGTSENEIPAAAPPPRLQSG